MLRVTVTVATKSYPYNEVSHELHVDLPESVVLQSRDELSAIVSDAACGVAQNIEDDFAPTTKTEAPQIRAWVAPAPVGIGVNS